MSLESSISDLVRASNDLTGAVSGKMDQINNTLAQWAVLAPITLGVGAGQQFASIQDAWNSLLGKVLKAPVTIQVADGVYPMTQLILENQPYAHLITIQGNVANPANCILKFIPDSDRKSHGVFLKNVRRLNFSGFKMIGENTNSNWTWRCMYFSNAEVYVNDNSLIFSGAQYGIEMHDSSVLQAKGVQLSQQAGAAVFVGDGSLARLEKLNIVGPGKDSRIPTAVSGQLYDVFPDGISCVDTAKAWCADATISNVRLAMAVERNAYLWAPRVTIDKVASGALANAGGCLWTDDGGTKVPSKVTNANYGYQALSNGMIIAPMAIAENCINGFAAELRGYIYAENGYAKSCTSTGYYAGRSGYIDAVGTAKNSVGNATQYNPASSGVAGNSNASIDFS
ncbi:hypothetical protein ACFFU8_03855 [Chromobacterium piscinae]|uniref:hypothetical protein n=1 Tax=Chromobacterium piscinae TaxID=686831 RepID=UPI001E2E153A|nr:hypothetical protein [Chromobacterium piscinae]MCD5326915.1 hypothetical protein [Chromobacterium piscinae]